MIRFTIALLLSLCLASLSQAQVVEMGRDNPALKVLYPRPGMLYLGFFMVETRNIEYTPQDATSAGSEFAIGEDGNGNPLFQNVGHLHGWVFETHQGELIRNDPGRPTPGSYYRFYGAGGAEFYGTYEHGLYIKWDDEPMAPGKYRAFFQAQQNDHTAMRQANAPAFPAIATVDFVVRGGSKRR